MHLLSSIEIQSFLYLLVLRPSNINQEILRQINISHHRYYTSYLLLQLLFLNIILFTHCCQPLLSLPCTLSCKIKNVLSRLYFLCKYICTKVQGRGCSSQLFMMVIYLIGIISVGFSYVLYSLKVKRKFVVSTTHRLSKLCITVSRI